MKFPLFILFFGIFMIMSLDVSINNESKNDLNPLGIETIIYPNEAIAQNVCTFNCQTGLDACGGAENCTQRWICGTGCGVCSMKWIKYTSGSSTGTCDNSGVVVD